MALPLTYWKAFHIPCVIGIVVSGIKVGHGARAVVVAPDFRGIAIADQADNRIAASEVAGPRPVSYLIQFERDCHAHSGNFSYGSPITERPIQIFLLVESLPRPRS